MCCYCARGIFAIDVLFVDDGLAVFFRGECNYASAGGRVRSVYIVCRGATYIILGDICCLWAGAKCDDAVSTNIISLFALLFFYFVMHRYHYW